MYVGGEKKFSEFLATAVMNVGMCYMFQLKLNFICTLLSLLVNVFLASDQTLAILPAHFCSGLETFFRAGVDEDVCCCWWVNSARLNTISSSV